MKIGIVTILDNKNYGNRWQNFALNKLLAELDIETENIYFWKRNTTGNKLVSFVKRVLPLKAYYYISRIMLYKMYIPRQFVRVCKSVAFTRHNMGAKLIFDSVKEAEYDYFAVGSDQVWNPYFNVSENYFLTFTEPAKRLAFMASMGGAAVPAQLIERYKAYFEQMRYISVREESAANEIKKISDKAVDTFLDPTLLLGMDKWRKIEKKPHSMPKKKYIISYFFSGASDEILKPYIGAGYSIISHFSYGPEEMLYLIDHAEMILTDSFHIAALSIKFNKQFKIFDRAGFEYMSDRFDTMLSRLNLSKCVVGEVEDRYENVNKILEEEKNRFTQTVKEITGKV